ncbi:MAG: hypothetical protein CL573_01855 [Alphaproteobacteria bacterium]|nr:hypothetical protein [Alphaproteobacteria bacterium]HCP00460.1 hypothetical protein [Rhodospirillaceae bacterium]|tara:strand:- start:1316 stop:2608 length:1293 start_codon:yes stop_codon:yes gene_type:complete
MSRYRIIIRAFTLRRDIASSVILARLLERAGAQVIIASGRDFTRLLRNWNPDAILINTVGQIKRCAELAPNASIILWPGEGAQPLPSSDATQLAQWPEAYERLSLALLWGPRNLDYFAQTMPHHDRSKLVMCGNPRLDMVKFNPDLLNVEKKTIGFIGRFHSLNRYNSVPAIFSLQYPEKRNGVVWQVESFITMITLIHRIINETDLLISIRPHPLEAPEGYEFFNEGPFEGRVEIDNSFDVADWTARQRVIITPSSQSFYESYVLGTPTIQMDQLSKTSDMIRQITPFAAMSQLVGYQPESYDEAIELIAHDPSVPPIQNDEVDVHLDEFHDWSSNTSSIARAEGAIMAHLANRKRPRGKAVPKALMQLWDRISFARVHKRDPLHQNFNYHESYHVIPDYYENVVNNIINGRSVYEAHTSKPITQPSAT